MKRFIPISLILVCFGTSAWAQKDPEALKILDAMSAKYQKVPAFRAKLSYTLQNTQEQLNENFQGEIAVFDNMYRLKIGGQEIINNGTTVWTYLEDVNEVNIDNYDAEEDEMSPGKIYTIYKEGFKYVMLQPEKKRGRQLDVVDLVPDDKDLQYFKIRLMVDQSDKSLVSYQVFDKNGNRYYWEVSEFIPDAQLAASNFQFDPSKYKGVEVVDLR